MDDSKRYKLRLTPTYDEVLEALEAYYHWDHIFYMYNDEAGVHCDSQRQIFHRSHPPLMYVIRSCRLGAL